MEKALNRREHSCCMKALAKGENAETGVPSQGLRKTVRKEFLKLWLEIRV
jgi:hypothetical protein